MPTFIEAIATTFKLCISLFGLCIVTGYILYYLHAKLQYIYRKTFGWYGILWTAWIGTPIHEISHLFFIQLFRHKATHIALFEPNEETGGLGSVDHSYNPRNIYHQIGNFFIGMAPLIIGSLILAAIIYTGFSRGPAILDRTFSAYNTQNSTPITIFTNGLESIADMASPAQKRSWLEYITLYFVVAISSHLIPSRKDIISALKGLPFLCGTLFIGVCISLLLSIPIHPFFKAIQTGTTVLAQLQLFIGFILLLHLLIISAIALPIHIMRHGVRS